MSAAKTVGKAIVISFLAFLQSKEYCNLELSPVVAAIAAASEGDIETVKEEIDDDMCRAIFACSADDLPREPRRTIAIEAGGGAGKSSRLLATKALHAAITVPMPHIMSNEKARAVIVCPRDDLDAARKVIDDIIGYVDNSPVLRKMRVHNERGKAPTSYVRLKRPDGKFVDLVAKAASNKALRSRRFVFVGMDEACFHDTDEGAAITDKELYRAGIQRVLPGGQFWLVSTPNIAEVGHLEHIINRETITAGDRVGERRHEHALAVARVSTRWMNPTWDLDGSIEADMRATDPENADREILAIPLTAGTSMFFDPVAIDKMFDPGAIPQFAGPVTGYGGGFDGGFKSDCTTAVLTRRHAVDKPKGDCFDTFDAFERRPQRGVPLVPSEVIGGAGRFAKNHGVRQLAADIHYRESCREHLAAEGVTLVDAPGGRFKIESHLAARQVMQEGRVRCSIADPQLRARFRNQLKSITKKPLPDGDIAISAPRQKVTPTGSGGGHGDLVSSWVLSMWRVGAGKRSSAKTAEAIGIGTVDQRTNDYFDG